jgi:hypothetical protein
MEAITVLEGEGRAWLQDDDLVPLRPGVTLVLSPTFGIGLGPPAISR